MQIRELDNFIKANQLPRFRLRQIIKAVYHDQASDFSQITTLPKDLRDQLSALIKILSFEAEKVLAAQDKKSFKALLKLEDNNYIETVLLKILKDQWSICLSSQAGCALGCRFCATGSAGFKRNLTSEEITDQALFWKQYIKKNNLTGGLSHVVFMGMGEPFLNYEEVKRSIKNLIDPELFNFASRHISVSTSGITEGIKKFAQDFPQVNLAISIVTGNEKKRTDLMPINKKHGLDEIRKALGYYFGKINRKVFFEYILLKDFNDSTKDADVLIDFIKSISRPDLIHVNLIRYNAAALGFKTASQDIAAGFKEYLEKNKIHVTIRKSLGEEIKGACGQLAGR